MDGAASSQPVPVRPGFAARPVSNLVSIGSVRLVADASGAPVLRDQTDRLAGHGKADPGVEPNSRVLVGHL